MVIELNGEGGIAGNLFCGALMALGGDTLIRLNKLPERLELNCGIDYRWKVKHGIVQARFDFLGTTTCRQSGNLAKMEERVREAWLPHDCDSIAVSMLRRRQESIAAHKADRMRFKGEEFADTLLDLCAAAVLWDAVGHPALIVKGPLELGTPFATIRQILPPVLAIEGEGAERVTPTGAAILNAFWQPGAELGTKTATAAVSGEYSQKGLIPPLTATLYT
jgi:uncharacterized protein (DUF111 family)